MKIESFFDEIDRHYKDQLPFAAYRLPNENTLTAWLQQTAKLIFTKDFIEEGFVFAPYDHASNAVLFEAKHSKILNSEGSFSQKEATGLKVDFNEREQTEYIERIQKAVNEIHTTELSKVVLSRVIKTKVNQKDPLILFKRLLHNYPNAFIYCWFHPKVGLWLGATPELLLSISRNKLTTVSLAGTISEDSSASWTEKEKLEQQLVTDYILSQLRSVTKNVEPGAVKFAKAGKLTHLKTEIKAIVDLQSNGLNAIISKLHPTPAVCGYPTGLAKRFIEDNESYDRQYYTGFLGEINCVKETSRTKSSRNVENSVFKTIIKQSKLFVNLRCFQLDGDIASIYVGGGIVASSVPEKEWQETADKSKTMLSIL